jgi:uncharacterized protein YndB with AHSA1/START domain
MSTKIDMKPEIENELVICRLIDAPPEKIFRAWTDPKLMKEWFCPKPWTIAKAETDVRTGGRSLVVMRSPEGQEFPNEGVYLEVIPNKKIVFTDAYTAGWVPTEKPFFTAIVELEAQGNKTKYTARARH